MPENGELTDDSIMLFGKQHRGKRLANVPASYLLWINAEWDDTPPEREFDIRLKKYIENNLEVLRLKRNRSSRCGTYIDVARRQAKEWRKKSDA